MRWKVVKDAGCDLTWPDGTVRAKPGEVFESFDEEPQAAVRKRAAVILRGKRHLIVPAPDEKITAGSNIPEDLLDRFREDARDAGSSFGYETRNVEKKKAAKPRARSKPATVNEDEQEDG